MATGASASAARAAGKPVDVERRAAKKKLSREIWAFIARRGSARLSGSRDEDGKRTSERRNNYGIGLGFGCTDAVVEFRASRPPACKARLSPNTVPALHGIRQNRCHRQRHLQPPQR